MFFNRFFTTKLLLVVGLGILPIASFAVTQKEMEQARVIAAKTYIRYANDLSGYLDELNPTTMEELQAVLKPKEKENIKAFLAIPVPTDYASWDKQQLVDYWAGTAFKDQGLEEKGRGGRVRARALINKMDIASAASEQPREETKQEEKVETPVSSEAVSGEEALAIAAADNGLPQETEAEVEAQDEMATLDMQEPEKKSESSDTWVYIMILGILVAVVIALVVYAANVMKKSNKEELRERRNNSDEGIDAEAQEKYENRIADKDFEISRLNKKLEAANQQNADLKSRLEALAAELALLKEKRPAERVEVTTSSGMSRQPVMERETVSVAKSESKTSLRMIYLGRANARGIFVRADRNLNPGYSIYVLDTTDGFSGSFRVAPAAEAWELALSNPAEYLMTACVGHNLEDTSGVSRIVTEDSGTAIFEGGCWRVIRKAKIRYE